MTKRMVVSWSLIPIFGVHVFTKLGRFVTTISKVLFPLVGKLTICSRLHDRNVSRKQSLMSLRYWCFITEFVSQLISGRFISPPNHIGLFLYFVFSFVISLLMLPAYSNLLLGGL